VTDHPGRPLVLIAHGLSLYSETLAQLLAERWHGLDIRLLDPAELEGVLVAAPGAIVVAECLTPAIEAHASGWLLYYPNEQNVAIAGGQGARRWIESPSLADILAAIDGLIVQQFPAGLTDSSAVQDMPAPGP
jgi:hypothetical protein